MPRAPLAGSQWTLNRNPSTSSEGLAVPSFDFCCRRAIVRCREVRAGPEPVWGGPRVSIMAIVKMPPNKGILDRGLLGIWGTGGRLGEC